MKLDNAAATNCLSSFFYGKNEVFERRGVSNMGKYDEAVKSYSAAKLSECKKKAREHFISKNGEVSVTRMAAAAKVPQGYIRKWLADGAWHLDIPAKLSDKVQDDISTEAERLGIPDKWETFCYHYIKTLNATNSALKAGYPPNRAHQKGYMILKEPKVIYFLRYLRDARNSEALIDSVRLIQEYMKIAFADMTDYVQFDGKNVTLKSSDAVDGQLITEVRKGKDGVTIKLADKMTALAKLEKHLGVDWREAVEKKKLELMERKLILEKEKLESGNDDVEDDGFIAALMGSAKEAWSDEEE